MAEGEVGSHREGSRMEDIHKEEVGIHREEDIHREVGIRRGAVGNHKEDNHKVGNHKEDIRKEVDGSSDEDIHTRMVAAAGMGMVAAAAGMAAAAGGREPDGGRTHHHKASVQDACHICRMWVGSTD
ncbi:hypothetical protein IWW50_005130, partial [Coemansia erecta]